MPINKDLSVSPYFDDFNEDKNYYKVLFKPSVAVQVRELNQLQTILQAQIEKFGNNIYKRGTIIDGVNFVYHPEYPYVKIKDSQLDGIPAAPSLYVGNFIIDTSSNLVAHIINSADGFESTSPDLKTLYLRYINSGSDGNTTAFSSGSVLKIYDYLDSVNKVNIDNGSSGFSNNDVVVFCSALSVNATSNTPFTIGETIVQSGNNNFAVVTNIQTVNGKSILNIRPRTADLSNTAVASNTWVFTPGEDIIGSTSGATATVSESIGNGAIAVITTTADIGKISDVEITERGQGYYVAPYCSIKSSGAVSSYGSRNYTDLSLTARNFLAQVTVSAGAGSVGNGYAFGVTEGVIYQKGHFVRVEPQTIIVEKYSSTPDQLAIGFDTLETIVDSNADQDLLDNATGTRNEFAPGADRLKLEPTLVVLTSEEAAANDEFLSIVEFSEGYPYRDNKRTQFNTIMDEMALRTSESTGDYVLNNFLVTTRSSANQSNEGELFTVVTDPGRGYINGYRVETNYNYSISNEKGIDTRSASSLTASIDYGNYILIKEVAGVFNCNVGDTVNLLSTAHGYVSNTTLVTAGAIPTSGDTVLGTARVRNIVYDSGSVGNGSAIYRLYLFSVKMNTGQSMKSVRAVRMASNAGIADVVLTFDATTNSNNCVLFDTKSGSGLLIPTGSDATKNISNLNYVYRTTNEAVNVANNGTASVLLSPTEETFDYGSSTLTDNEKKSIIFMPTSGNLVLQPNTTSYGTANVTSSSNTVTIASASVNLFDIGDWVALFSDATTYVMRKVTAKTSTTLQVDSNVSFTQSAISFSPAYPKYVPISLDRVIGATATLSGGSKTLNINLGSTVRAAAATTCSLTYDVKITGATSQAKTAERDNFVKINLASKPLNGPWCLGIPDIFRLKNVYLGTSSSVNTSSTDVTDQFYIDHNQTADYYDLGYLYLRSDHNLTLTSSNWLLVQFDAFTSTPGVFTVSSYVSSNTDQRFADDSLTLSGLGTKTNSFEIPEVYTSGGKYYDLINYIDFRPVAANTVVYAKTAANANTNPSATVTFSGSNKKFPLPESGLTFDRENFLGRKDTVVITNDNQIKVVRGVPAESIPYPDAKTPNGTLVLNKLIIPAYPTIPQRLSTEMTKIIDRKMSNERSLQKRIRDKTVQNELNEFDIAISQPKAFTMADINRLERRVQDLEYNVALSQVEADLKDKTIPSSVSPEINRFKFGFYVDDFKTKKNSDLDSFEYQADVIDSRVVPITESVLTTHGRGYRVSDFVSEVSIVKQDLASEVPPPVVLPPPAQQTPPVVVTPPSTTPVVTPPVPTSPPPPPAPAQTPVITAKTVSLYRSYKNSTNSGNDSTGLLLFSSVPGTYSVNYNFYGDSDVIQILKLSKPAPTMVYNSLIKKKGTLTFNHDPSTGREYSITVYKSSKNWEYTLNYPIDNVSFVDAAPPEVNINQTTFTGKLVGIYPGYTSAPALNQNFSDLAYVSSGDTQFIKVVGLKPNTVHNVKLSDHSNTIRINQYVTTPLGVNGATTTQIISDALGVAEFNIGINTQNQIAGYVYSPETVQVYIASFDETSTVTFNLVTKQASKTAAPAYNSTPVAVLSPPTRNGGGRAGAEGTFVREV